MIVKNEEHVIKSTLECISKYIDYYIICDTGSTDNTKKFIKDFFDKKNIKGEIHDIPWKNFGYNRSVALELCNDKCEYCWIIDADDIIIGDLILPTVLDKDCYYLLYGGDFTYNRNQIFRIQSKWKYVGVLHEYPTCEKKNEISELIKGNYYIDSRRLGNRNKDPDKYKKDAQILLEALKENPNCSRNTFYLAQSYRDYGEYKLSNKYYLKRFKMGGWDEEIYYSLYMIGKNNIALCKSAITIENSLLEAYRFRTSRLEALYDLIFYLYYTEKNIEKASKYAKLGLGINSYSDKLFITSTIYDYKFKDLASIILFCNKEYKLSYKIINTILHHCKLPDNQRSRIESNKSFCIPEILSNYIEYPKLKINSLNEINSYNCNILFTITSCKRLDLFIKTINSFLNCCNDIKKIDKFICIDDNSSLDDRKTMKNMYPFIDFVYKNHDERGHVNSMNKIYKLIEIYNPKYIIHLEDDWHFHTKYNFISNGITILENDNSIGQVLFNRNYAELHDKIDTSIPGGIKKTINSIEYLEHEYCPNGSDLLKQFNKKHHGKPSNAYWPNFSFRPSILSSRVIKKIGEYSDTNGHFEMDYANRFTNLGYKSAFYNGIFCRHIGKLTPSRRNNNSDNSKNAYELNNIDQFTNKVLDNNIPIKIVNLKRRKDRKLNLEKILKQQNINSYEFIEAVDGNLLKPTLELKYLFEGNDFASRKGVIGCALSHYNLWKRLLEDNKNDYYLIMEDDITLCNDFKKKLNSIKLEFINKEFLFLGYHMFEKERIKVKNKYNNNNVDIKIQKLNKNLYIGGYFAYTINKSGAKKMINYIDDNGIKHGIDYLNKIMKINNYECIPQLVFSTWNEGGKKIDTDIQNNYNSLDFSSLNNIKVAFHDNCLCERGTSTSLYDYAYYNEKIINNKSIIFYNKNNANNKKQIIEKFNKQFTVYGYTEWSEIDIILKNEECKYLYLIKYGNNDGKLSTYANNLIHCVFTCNEPHGNIYTSISPSVKNNDGNYPIVPHMINLPDHNGNLRQKLKIPENAIVFGGYGGKYNFNIKYVVKIVVNIAKNNPNIYFLFANFNKFSENLNNIIFLPTIINTHDKVKFINTCDAMIWARADGETFGIAIGEFSSKNKPILACKSYSESNNFDTAHVKLLGEKAIWYNKDNLEKIILNFNPAFESTKDWNAYKEYTPKKVMKIFEKTFLNLDNDFVFISQKDQIGNDIYFNKNSIFRMKQIALKNEKCVGFNTLGFFKNKIDNLTISKYFNHNDGIYIKKDYYEKFIKGKKKKKEKKKKNILLSTPRSGNHLVRTIIEYITKRPTLGCRGSKNDLPIYKNDNLDLNIEIQNDLPIYFKEHDLFTHNYVNNLSEIENLILILRNPYELFLREFHNLEYTNKSYYDNIEKFNEFIGNKLLLYYEDLVTNKKASIIKIFKFLKINDETILDDIIENVDKIYQSALIISKKTGGGKCINNLNKYHDDCNDISKKNIIDNIFKKNYSKYQKYLKRFYKTKIKILCNWCSSKQLCKEWSNLSPNGLRWDNLELTYDDTDIDYYVIINKPIKGAKFEPKKTIIFQMEPWINDETKNWGVKTWGNWAEPDENKFLYVSTHKKELNNVQWWVNLPVNIPKIRKNKVISVLSEKSFDIGHELRINISKSSNKIDVYGRENYHKLENYIGTLKNKEDEYVNYKYCLVVENNNEKNYATEKIWDGILCECLCFYWGCSNLEEYIDSDAFIRLDKNDIDKSIKIIDNALKNDEWLKRIDTIKLMKNKIINKLGFFPRLKNIIYKK